MDNLSVSNIHGNMVDRSLTVGIEDQVTRTHLTGFDGPAGLCLFSGSSRKADACHMAQHILHETRAVRTGMRVIASPDITSSHKLQRVVHHLAAQGCGLVCFLLQR